MSVLKMPLPKAAIVLTKVGFTRDLKQQQKPVHDWVHPETEVRVGLHSLQAVISTRSSKEAAVRFIEQSINVKPDSMCLRWSSSLHQARSPSCQVNDMVQLKWPMICKRCTLPRSPCRSPSLRPVRSIVMLRSNRQELSVGEISGMTKMAQKMSDLA